jgi:hypothetical protein
MVMMLFSCPDVSVGQGSSACPHERWWSLEPMLVLSLVGDHSGHSSLWGLIQNQSRSSGPSSAMVVLQYMCVAKVTESAG